MNIFPNIPELILAIFTAMLSLGVSLFLVKIHSANTKSMNKLEEEQKVLIARQSETKDFIRSKLVTLQETKEARDFLEKEAMVFMDEIHEKMMALNFEKRKTTTVTIVGMLLTLLTVGANIYLYFILYKNGGRIYLSELVVIAFISIFSLIYFWFEGRLLKKYIKDFLALENRFLYVSNEIIRATDLANKGFNLNPSQKYRSEQ